MENYPTPLSGGLFWAFSRVDPPGRDPPECLSSDPSSSPLTSAQWPARPPWSVARRDAPGRKRVDSHSAAGHSVAMPTDYFDEKVAERYDTGSAEMFDPGAVEPVVDLLARLVGDGRALELGIGTGRIALPLSQRGVPVHGVDLSPSMVARLQAKPGASRIGVTVGDFATTKVEGPFRLAYLVFNTIMNLTTQAAQVGCFCNVAGHLEPGGTSWSR